MKKSEKILEKLYREGEMLEIPEGIKPEAIEELLKEQRTRIVRKKIKIYPILAAAACFCLVTGLLVLWHPDRNLPSQEWQEQKIVAEVDPGPEASLPDLAEEEQELLELPVMTYGQIYARLSETWQQQVRGYDIPASAEMEDALIITGGTVVDLQAASRKYKEEDTAYGRTNVQVEQVDEADCVKNDGRYLYQIARMKTEGDNSERCGIQILDTQDGLKEAAFLDGFESLEEFYVWEDLLIAIGNKCSIYAGVTRGGWAACYKTGYQDRSYHEISVYDIASREAPRKIKTFTLQGQYQTSRIYDGYFYGISQFTADAGEGEEDYGAYIPTLDGVRLSADRIYWPEGSKGTSYLVFVSIDLKNPSVFVDSRAVLSGSSTYYMSRKNIYVADHCSVYEDASEQEGRMTDKTKLLRLSCVNGRFYAQAQGEIPGRLNDSFSLDEYQGNLRVVSTVQEYEVKKVTDDRTGERIGMDYREISQTNALYILDQKLTILGEITGLAEGEQIYSARFLGDTGYFVTFRQTDPLFAVDLSDPAAPTVLGELKVSGFSEYLHFYETDLLLGIGKEADEETGREQGMKLSMFDISDPASPAEAARLNLEDYNYSEALWDHRAVLIDTEENLIGFCAEGSNKGKYWMHYLVFSYEDNSFVQKLKLDARTGDDDYLRARGTFIGDVFYLLKENGSARSYDRNSGKLLEEI